MHVLGISAFHRDSAAALVRDDELIAVLAEERFTRNPHEAAFPRRAVRACLARAGIEPHELDAVALAEKPSRSFERLLQEELARFPRSWSSFPKMQLSWLGERLWARARVATEIGVPSSRVLFVESQRARAAWALLATRRERAAILVCAEAREWATTTLAIGRAGTIEVLDEVHAPHGLCRFAAEAARQLGFSGLEDLPRLALLAELGEPRRRAELASVLAIGADGSHTLALAGLEAALGIACAQSASCDTSVTDGGPSSRADAAASVIRVLGDALLAAAHELARRTHCEDLCLGGELAALSVLHSRLIEEGPFRRVAVPPAPGEVGAAAGAALLAARSLGAPRARPLEHAFLGEDLLLAGELDAQHGVGIECLEIGDRKPIERALDALNEGRLVGWMRGQAEVGRRALGHRSVLADPASARARERLREHVGGRQTSFAYAVPAERASELFEIPEGAVDAARLVPLCVRPRPAARARLDALLHAGTCVEVHLVEPRVEPVFHELLTRFGQRCDMPLLIDLPLGRRGEPSVRREIDALELLQRGVVDLLCVEERVLVRSERATSSSSAASAGSPRT